MTSNTTRSNQDYSTERVQLLNHARRVGRTRNGSAVIDLVVGNKTVATNILEEGGQQ